jgi:hypothetical protein
VPALLRKETLAMMMSNQLTPERAVARHVRPLISPQATAMVMGVAAVPNPKRRTAAAEVGWVRLRFMMYGGWCRPTLNDRSVLILSQ